MNTLKIEYVDIDSITPYKNNTKKHPQEQIDQIKASVEKFKVCKPIGVADETILTGHGLHESLKQLNHKKVAIIDLSHLSESERKAYIIADNKIAESSTWDNDLLKIELESLEDAEFNCLELGLDFDLSDEWETDIEIPDYDPANDTTEEKIIIKCEDSLVAQRIKDELSIIISEKGIIGATVS